jgi:hypothetical protein
VSDYEKRRQAVEKMANDMVRHSGGKITHDKAHQEAQRIARESDARKGK